MTTQDAGGRGGRTERRAASGLLRRAACDEAHGPWELSAARLGSEAQCGLQSASRTYDNATGGAYSPLGEGCLSDQTYQEQGESQKLPRLRATTWTPEGRRLACQVGLLQRDVAAAARATGAGAVLDAMRLVGGDDYIFPPELEPGASLGQTQVGVRLKGFPQGGWDGSIRIREIVIRCPCDGRARAL